MRPLLLRACAVAALLPAVLLASNPPLDPTTSVAPTGRYSLFRIFDGEVSANRVQYGVRSNGQIGVDPINSTAITMAFWPRGTGNQYMFNSGVQVAGIIGGTRATNPWAGDTTMGLFFDPSGLREHGTGVTSLSNAAITSHLAAWPQAGYLPHGTAGVLFADALAGRASAGNADVWWLSWEGDPGLNSARPHPLGIVAEHRVMGWTAPRGNEDILYLMVTFYNITARDAAAYASYRPGLREMLAAQAAEFHALNEAEFAIDLPEAGYTIDPFYAGLAADPDVTVNAGTNLTTVNVPLAMSFAWHADFPRATGWTFDPSIFSAPFAARSGLVGTAMLRNLNGTATMGFHTGLTNGGVVPDPNSPERALHYLSGDVAGDPGITCNTGTASVTRICHVPATPSDVRMLHASPQTVLPPGGSATMVFAYVHAAPVAIVSAPTGTRVFAGDPTRLTRATDLALGANLIDSIAGYTGFVDDNGNGQVEGRELRAVSRSLIAKAQLAQVFFEQRFLSPAAPEAPDFFLIPGDGAVTVTWRPSDTDHVGDPYFSLAREALITPSGGGAPVPNPLYDPNYRQFDVEGYRIWRGRSDAADALELVAQFDHQGTRFRDFGAQVTNSYQGWNRCAPELGVQTDCAGTYDAPVPGIPRTRSVSYDIVGSLRQVAYGDRIVLPNGEIELLAVDTLSLDPPPALGGWSNSGVPYVWRDSTVRNGLTYFYAVTAFDVNAINSTGAGNTSLESPRITRRVTPRVDASNLITVVSMRSYLRGRSGELTDTVTPVLHAVTGRFDKRFPIADGFEVTPYAPLVELLAGPAEARVRLDSARVIALTELGSNATVSVEQHYTVDASDGSSTRLMHRIELNAQSSTHFSGGILPPMLMADPERTARFGGSTPTGTSGGFAVRWPGLYYTTSHGRGCANRAVGFGFPSGCNYNGPRWFNGVVETRDHPNSDNAGSFLTGAAPLQFNNAGELDAVRTIYHPQAYEMTPTSWRRVEAVLGAFAGGADYRLYWGTGGVIDSVIDLTYDVPVPFSTHMGLSWGVLNGDAVSSAASDDQRAALTYTDATCVEPLKSLTLVQASVPCGGNAVSLERIVRPSAVALAGGNSYASNRTAPVAPGPGFLLYLKGRLFLMELESGPPPSGTGWTMRDYVGAIAGGIGVAGNHGPYAYTAGSAIPLTAAGAEVVVRVDGGRSRAAASEVDLSRVHTVPDPYYHRVDAAAATQRTGVTFVNLPARATIRVYSSSGILIRTLRHDSAQEGGETTWDLQSRSGRGVASGVYFYHVAADGGGTAVGRLAVVR